MNARRAVVVSLGIVLVVLALLLALFYRGHRQQIRSRELVHSF